MPILLGLEVAAGVAVASALNSDRLGTLASQEASLARAARSLVRDELNITSDSDAPCSPVRVSLRVRSLRLPMLYVAKDHSANTILNGNAMLVEQLSNAVPRRFGDAGGSWHLLFSTDRDGTSLGHMLRRYDKPNQLR